MLRMFQDKDITDDYEPYNLIWISWSKSYDVEPYKIEFIKWIRKTKLVWVVSYCSAMVKGERTVKTGKFCQWLKYEGAIPPAWHSKTTSFSRTSTQVIPVTGLQEYVMWEPVRCPNASNCVQLHGIQLPPPHSIATIPHYPYCHSRNRILLIVPFLRIVRVEMWNQNLLIKCLTAMA